MQKEMVVALIWFFRSMVILVQDAGGTKEPMIAIGKEVKDISKQVNED